MTQPAIDCLCAPVAALLFTGFRRKDVAVASEAALIARSRGTALIGLQVSPRQPRGALLAAGFDPDKLERGELADSRRAIREMFEVLGFPRAPIVLVGRPPVAAALRVGAEFGVKTLLVPPLPSIRWRRKLRGITTRTIEVVVAYPTPSGSSLSAHGSGSESPAT